jgi:biotin transport system substrate-specific component
MNQVASVSQTKPGLSTLEIAQCAVVIALIAVGAQITVAVGPVPFTLQLLVVVLASLIFKPRQALIALAGYVLLGLVGLPVFSGAAGGFGKICGLTGGYIYGFIVSAFLGSLLRRAVLGKSGQPGRARRIASDVAACVVTVAVCYAIGTVHFMAVSSFAGSGVDLAYVLGACVIPFILPDVLKCVAAVLIAWALRAAVPSLARN